MIKFKSNRMNLWYFLIILNINILLDKIFIKITDNKFKKTAFNNGFNILYEY